MPSDGGGEVFLILVRVFLVEKLDLGYAAAAATGVEGNDVFRPGSLGELANLLERVEHLVVEDGEVEHLVEDGEVEHQTEVNWMRGLHLVFFLVVY